MHSKKPKRDAYKRSGNSKDLKRKIDSSKLLDKAMGRMHKKTKRGGK